MKQVPKSSGFSGNGKNSMGEHTLKYHEVVNKDISSELEKAEKEFKKLIEIFSGSVDSSETCILDYEYVKDIANKFRNKISPLDNAIEKCNSGVNDARGLANVTNLKRDSVMLLQDTCNSATETVGKLEKFNHRQKSKDLIKINDNSSSIEFMVNENNNVTLEKRLQTFWKDLRK